jgi:hypothetical protein
MSLSISCKEKSAGSAKVIIYSTKDGLPFQQNQLMEGRMIKIVPKGQLQPVLALPYGDMSTFSSKIYSSYIDTTLFRSAIPTSVEDCVSLHKPPSNLDLSTRRRLERATIDCLLTGSIYYYPNTSYVEARRNKMEVVLRAWAASVAINIIKNYLPNEDLPEGYA